MSEGAKLFLFSLFLPYSPQSTMGMSPTKFLMGRTLRSRLHLLKPNFSQTVKNKLEQQKSSHDKQAIDRSFLEEKVFVR